MSRIKGGHLLDTATQERIEFIHFLSKMVTAATTAIARPLRLRSTQSAEEPTFWMVSLIIQVTRSPPIRDQTRNCRLDARPPNLQAVPPKHISVQQGRL